MSLSLFPGAIRARFSDRFRAGSALRRLVAAHDVSDAVILAASSGAVEVAYRFALDTGRPVVRLRLTRGPLPPLQGIAGRHVVLVDDGCLAPARLSALTLAIRAGHPRRLEVAMPVITTAQRRAADADQVHATDEAVVHDQPLYDDLLQVADWEAEAYAAETRDALPREAQAALSTIGW